jgi:predicted unusual protein kinase regulating ubiquinone biosynthesis (AarF/ABC1/UbiB family)
MNLYKIYTYVSVIYKIGLFYFFKRNIKDLLTEVIPKISKLNIIFCKMLQWFSYDVGGLEESEIEQIFSIYNNNVPFQNCEIDHDEIHKLQTSLQKDGKQLELIYPPINAGTIAIVFKAKLNDDDVILKILRKDIHNRLEKDIDELLEIMNLFSFLSKVLFFRKFLFNLKPILLKQTDLTNEKENIDFFYNKFKNSKHIIIPCANELSNSKILILNYIKNDLTIKQLNEDETVSVMTSILLFQFKCTILINKMHGDLHEGNMRLLRDNNEIKLGLIDWGVTVELNKSMQNFWCDMFEQLDKQRLKDILINNLEIILKENNSCDLIDYVIRNIKNIENNYEEELITHKDILSILEIIINNNVIIPDGLFAMLLTLASWIAVQTKLAKKTNSHDVMKKYKNNYKRII